MSHHQEKQFGYSIAAFWENDPRSSPYMSTPSEHNDPLFLYNSAECSAILLPWPDLAHARKIWPFDSPEKYVLHRCLLRCYGRIIRRHRHHHCWKKNFPIVPSFELLNAMGNLGRSWPINCRKKYTSKARHYFVQRRRLRPCFWENAILCLVAI